MAGERRRRAVERIALQSARAQDLVAFWQGAAAILAETLPHYWSPCWYTLDPASLLITSHYNAEMAAFPPAWLEAEYVADDVNQLMAVARSRSGLSTLHDATGGDPASSPRWHENIKLGGDQEMIVALRTRSGENWGALGIYRSTDQPLFDDADKAYVRALAPHLAEGARRALMVGEALEPDGPDSPGMVVLDERGRPDSSTVGVEALLRLLPDGEGMARLPTAVLAVGARARRPASPGALGRNAVARVRGSDGRWLVLHGAALEPLDSGRVAVIVAPAHPARIHPLLASVYGLTDREREVTRLVLDGASTQEIADALVLSPHTVQQHLKNIFGKTGVRSRRDLVAKVFFSHYEPRLRDNERRAARGMALRGDPFPPASSV